MFHNIPTPIQERMAFLEATDSRDRKDGTPHLQRMRQIPPETGRFLALMAASAPLGNIIEVGTSAGYSTLWLSLACRVAGRKMTTYELLEAKVELARETFRVTGTDDIINLIAGDARRYLTGYDHIAFCFLDTEKEIYDDCFDLVIPKLVPGGLLIADNAISHQDALAPTLQRTLDDNRVDALIVPIGKGLLFCRRNE